MPGLLQHVSSANLFSFIGFETSIFEGSVRIVVLDVVEFLSYY